MLILKDLDFNEVHVDHSYHFEENGEQGVTIPNTLEDGNYYMQLFDEDGDLVNMSMIEISEHLLHSDELWIDGNNFPTAELNYTRMGINHNSTRIVSFPLTLTFNPIPGDTFEASISMIDGGTFFRFLKSWTGEINSYDYNGNRTRFRYVKGQIFKHYTTVHVFYDSRNRVK